MTATETLAALNAYQAWRRGSDERTMDEAGLTPAQIGKALDSAIEKLAMLNHWHSATDAQLRQMAGELSAQEIRTIRAVLNAIAS